METRDDGGGKPKAPFSQGVSGNAMIRERLADRHIGYELFSGVWGAGNKQIMPSMKAERLV